jgi:hypothetical protein
MVFEFLLNKKEKTIFLKTSFEIILLQHRGPGDFGAERQDQGG